MPFIQTLLILGLTHILALASPGPDFILVSQGTLRYGRRYGILLALGIGLGISVHVLYTTLGLALVISRSIYILTTIKILAAGYLIYLGISGLRAKAASQGIVADTATAPQYRKRSAILRGFLCNFLNPKAVFYFLSIFTTIIPTPVQPIAMVVYWLQMSLLTFAWFTMVSIFFSAATSISKFKKFSHHIDHAFGIVMLAIAGELFYTVIRDFIAGKLF